LPIIIRCFSGQSTRAAVNYNGVAFQSLRALLGKLPTQSCLTHRDLFILAVDESLALDSYLIVTHVKGRIISCAWDSDCLSENLLRTISDILLGFPSSYLTCYGALHSLRRMKVYRFLFASFSTATRSPSAVIVTGFVVNVRIFPNNGGHSSISCTTSPMTLRVP